MGIPWRHLPPNLAASARVGVAALHATAPGDDAGPARLILPCMLLDKVDGTLARLLRARSRFGVEMDSFADFVAFGLAPGFLLMSLGEGLWTPAYAFACLFIGGSLARLVRFNVMDAAALPDHFHGLPTTVAGGQMTLLYLVGQKYGVEADAHRALLCAAAVALALLMVSPLPLPKFGRTGSRLLNALMLASALASAVTILLRVWPEFVLVQSGIYVLGGSAYALVRRQGG